MVWYKSVLFDPRTYAAYEQAVRTVRTFCEQNADKIDIVRFVLFDPRTYAAYEQAVKELCADDIS